MATSATNNIFSTFATPETTKPGQGTSKFAQKRRRKAAQKSAQLSKDSAPDAMDACPMIPTKTTNTANDAKINMSSMSTRPKVLTIINSDTTQTNSAPEASVSVKKTMHGGFKLNPRTKPHVDEHGWTVVPFFNKRSGSESHNASSPLYSRTSPSHSAALRVSEGVRQAQDKARSETSKADPESKTTAPVNKLTSIPSPEPTLKSIDGSRAVSSASYSWASVCSSPPSVHRAAPAPQHEPPLKRAEAETQAVPTASDFPEMVISPALQIHSASIEAAFIALDPSDSWVKVAVSQPVVRGIPTTKLSEGLNRPSGNIKETLVVAETSSKADFPTTLPSSLSSTGALPAVPHEGAMTSPSFKKPVTPNIDFTNMSPQPKPLLMESSTSFPSPIVEQDYDNLLEMIRPQRQLLLEGPRVTIHVGDIAIKEIPKRAIMAASSVLHKHFRENPESQHYCFSNGFMHPGAVRLLLTTWMQATCQEFEAYAVPIRKTFDENVALLRASRFLGMERYTKHILVEYVDYLKSQLPSYDEIRAVEENATSDKDPLWTAMVNHLCHDRFKGLIPDPEEFAAFLEKHPRLEKGMNSADAFFSGMAKQKWEAKEAERRQRWEKSLANKKERLAREEAAADSLKQKIGATGSGITTITVDQAAILRGR